MLGDISGVEHISLACGYTDLRLGIDGLAQLVQQQFSLDPFSNSLFLFCGRRCDRISLFFWLYHSFKKQPTSSKLSKSRIASIGTLPPQSCSQSYRRLLIYDLKRTLTAKEFSVIYALIFKELSVAEIAEKQGISRQAVNQMKNSAIKKLRSR